MDTKPKYTFIYVLVFVVGGAFLYNFISNNWGGGATWKNQERAKQEIRTLELKLKEYDNFSHVRCGVQTANLSRDIVCDGIIPNEESLNSFKRLVNGHFSKELKIYYSVIVDAVTYNRLKQQSVNNGD